jgi:hypothetical protein
MRVRGGDEHQHGVLGIPQLATPWSEVWLMEGGCGLHCCQICVPTKRKEDAHCRPLIDLTLNVQGATVRLHDVFDNSKPEAGTPELS